MDSRQKPDEPVNTKSVSASEMLRIGADTAGMLNYVYHWLTSTTFQGITYHNPKASAEATNKIAVYCVHGIVDRATAFDILARKLIQDLPETISSINLVAFNKRLMGKSIKNFSHQLGASIKANGDKNIYLLGHSRGALVAAHFAEYLAGDLGINVHAVFTICAPFHGTHLAARPATFFSTSIKQMELNSPFLKELRDKIQKSKIKYYFCAAEKDGVVDPETCRAENTHNPFVTFNKHGHLSIMVYSEKLIEYIRGQLMDACAMTKASQENLVQLKSRL